MTVYTITGSASGSVTLDPLVPLLWSLDADDTTWSGSIPGLTWVTGETEFPMPYPPTAHTGWYQDDIFDPVVSLTWNSLTVSGYSPGSVDVAAYLVLQNVAPGGWTNGFNQTDIDSPAGAGDTFPVTKTDFASWYLNWYQHLSLRFDGSWFPSVNRTVTFDVDWSMSADRPDPAPGGIYVGSIVLEQISG